MAGKGNSRQALAGFFAGDDKDRGGVRLAAKDTDGIGCCRGWGSAATRLTEGRTAGG
jgi:hypothetical protein